MFCDADAPSKLTILYGTLEKVSYIYKEINILIKIFNLNIYRYNSIRI